jgi:putative endopeptidase
LALLQAIPALAQDRCLDESCTIVALLPSGSPEGLRYGAEDQAGGQRAAETGKPLHYGTWGFDTSGMDRSVKPGDDWFNFVNGTWAKNTQIPPDRTSFGAFATLRDVSEARLHTMVERYKIDDADADKAKIATIYKSFMDEPAIERAGAAPLQPYLARIKKAASKDDIARLMGQSLGGFGASFFAPGVSDDAKRPDV